MTDRTDNSETEILPNECCGNKLPSSTNVVGKNINEAVATNVEGTDISEGKKLYLQYSQYRYEFLKNRQPNGDRRPMRLPEFLYAITKLDTTEYEYDMDDPSDVKLYQLSQLNRKPISELLADKTDESKENPEYDNDIVLSQSEEIRIDEEAGKESECFFPD